MSGSHDTKKAVITYTRKGCTTMPSPSHYDLVLHLQQYVIFYIIETYLIRHT